MIVDDEWITCCFRSISLFLNESILLDLEGNDVLLSSINNYLQEIT